MVAIGFTWKFYDARTQMVRDRTVTGYDQNRDRYVVSSDDDLPQLLSEKDLNQDCARDTKNLLRALETHNKKTSTTEPVSSLYGFDDRYDAKTAGRIRSTLRRPISIDGHLASRADHVHRMVRTGSKVIDKNGQRVIAHPSGGFHLERDLSKTALDFAEYLLDLV